MAFRILNDFLLAAMFYCTIVVLKRPGSEVALILQPAELLQNVSDPVSSPLP